MELPDYIYPNYYDYNLVVKNKQELNSKDLKLFKNLKFSKNFKDTEKIHLNFILEKQEYWKEKQKKLSLEENRKDSEYSLFDFILIFKQNNFLNKKYNLNIYFTNAFRKIYEICEKSKFINSNLKKVRHFDICSMPGGFIFGINHFLKTRNKTIEYDWYNQSYTGKGKSYFKDEFGLVKKNKERFLTGDSTGDITKIKNINIYYKFFEKNKCDIVTSDCGLDNDLIFGKSKYLKEKQMAKTFYSQLICGLGVLKKGGNFFMKTYHSFSKFSISLIYLLGVCFEEVKLVKPESSRQLSGKEIYYLCLNLKKELSDLEKERLLLILKNFDEEILNQNIISYSNMNKVILKNIEDTLSDYYLNKISLKNKVSDFKVKTVGVTIFDDPKKYFIFKKLVNESSQEALLDYYKNYFKIFKYKKISNKDKLV